MINKKYYDEFEGEDAVKIWKYEHGIECGILVWRGFFEAVLEGCFRKDFQRNGIVECYYNQNGFFDDRWELEHPLVVLHELACFDENQLDHLDKAIVHGSKEVIRYLVSFINTAASRNQRIYIEYV